MIEPGYKNFPRRRPRDHSSSAMVAGKSGLLLVLLLAAPHLLLTGCAARIVTPDYDGDPRCAPGFVWVRKPEGGRCMRDRSWEWRRRSPVATTTPPSEEDDEDVRRFGFAPRPVAVTPARTRNHFGFGPAKTGGRGRHDRFSPTPRHGYSDPFAISATTTAPPAVDRGDFNVIEPLPTPSRSDRGHYDPRVTYPNGEYEDEDEDRREGRRPDPWRQSNEISGSDRKNDTRSGNGDWAARLGQSGRNEHHYYTPVLPRRHKKDRRSDTGGYALPTLTDRLDEEHTRCLRDERVLWPADRRCYRLLHQGPCADGEWLVLRASSTRGEVRVTCAARPCPCSPDDPLLCEVPVDEPGCGSRCAVSLAAEQDGLCGAGEQLLLSPFGKGVCGCRVSPRPHLRRDGACHPVHTRGSCPRGFTLQISSGRPACVANLCPDDDNLVLHTDGRCYEVDTRGPCDGDSRFTFFGGNADPLCKPLTAVKRMFDMAPADSQQLLLKLRGGRGGGSSNAATDAVLGGISATNGHAKSKKDSSLDEDSSLAKVFSKSMAERAVKVAEMRAREYLEFLFNFLLV